MADGRSPCGRCLLNPQWPYRSSRPYDHRSGPSPSSCPCKFFTGNSTIQWLWCAYQQLGASCSVRNTISMKRSFGNRCVYRWSGWETALRSTMSAADSTNALSNTVPCPGFRAKARNCGGRSQRPEGQASQFSQEDSDSTSGGQQLDAGPVGSRIRSRITSSRTGRIPQWLDASKCADGRTGGGSARQPSSMS